jgi:hypothetical protein
MLTGHEAGRRRTQPSRHLRATAPQVYSTKPPAQICGGEAEWPNYPTIPL